MARLARTLVAGSLVAPFGAALALSGAGPAGAAATISISSPAGGQAYQSQPAIRGSAAPDTAEHLSRNIQLEVRDTDQAGLVDLTTVVTGTAGYTTAAPFAWQPTLPYNGHYLAVVTVWEANPAGLEDGPYNATQSFVMQVPPARPAPPAVALGADRASASVAWRPNSEPDLLGYQLLRTPSYAGGRVPTIAKGDTLCSPSACSYTDSDVTPGTAYQYQVEAVRSAGPGTTSGVTATSDFSPKLAVPAPAGASTTVGTAGAGTAGATAAQGAAAAQPAQLAPALARTGRVDLSGFAALLDHSRAAALRPPPEVDTGFQTALPYSPAQPEPGRGGDPVARRATVLGAGDGPARVRPWALFALGLLVTAVALHLLWLRGEVRHDPDLEALPVPGPRPPARAGRRAVPVPAPIPAPPSPTASVAVAATARPRELRRLAG